MSTTSFKNIVDEYISKKPEKLIQRSVERTSLEIVAAELCNYLSEDKSGYTIMVTIYDRKTSEVLVEESYSGMRIEDPEFEKLIEDFLPNSLKFIFSE